MFFISVEYMVSFFNESFIRMSIAILWLTIYKYA